MNPEPGLVPGFFVTLMANDPRCRLVQAKLGADCGGASSGSPEKLHNDFAVFPLRLSLARIPISRLPAPLTEWSANGSPVPIAKACPDAPQGNAPSFLWTSLGTLCEAREAHRKIWGHGKDNSRENPRYGDISRSPAPSDGSPSTTR